jgi:hypothetical protein
MLYYEIKKVFSRNGNKFAVLLLEILILFVVVFCTNSSIWVNAKGEVEQGPGAIQKMKKASLKWSGPLTNDKIAQIIVENRRINETPEAKSENTSQQNIAYGRKQGFMDIRELINKSYSEFREYDYYKADRLKSSDAEYFYSNRIDSLKRWLEGEAKYYYTETEKNYFLQQYKKMEEPLNYEYMDGWKNLLEYAPTMSMIITIIIGIIIAPIFSCEKQLSADAVFFSAYYGRSRAVYAKGAAGFLITTVIYWVTMLLYTGIILMIFGVSGADCKIQAADSWKSFYNMTNLQEYLIVFIGGYLGCSFMAVLTMYVSAKFKSTVLAAIVPFLLIFAPSFLGFINSRWLSEALGLFPDQLLQLNMTFNLFNVYEIGGKVVGGVILLFVIYLLLTALLIPVIFLEFQESEVKG